MPWVVHQRTKVQSHIPKEAATNEEDWIVNDEADQLATEARDKVSRGEMMPREPRVLEGTGAQIRFNDKICTTAIKPALQFHLYEQETREYLCLKYGWSRRTFQAINWEGHKSALQRFSTLQQITVTKFLHGWLATKKHRYRAGRIHSPLCPFCQQEEDRTHIFHCTEERMKEKRRQLLSTISHKLKHSLTAEAAQAMLEGLHKSWSKDQSTVFYDEFLTGSKLREAYVEQASIGWEHLMYGRLSSKWMYVGFLDTYKKPSATWAADITKCFLQAGVELWKHRNQLIHGFDGDTSLLQVENTSRLVNCIRVLVEQKRTVDNEWLLSRASEDAARSQFAQQIAWLDGIKRLMPDVYQEAVSLMHAEDVLTSELEYVKTRCRAVPH